MSKRSGKCFGLPGLYMKGEKYYFHHYIKSKDRPKFPNVEVYENGYTKPVMVGKLDDPEWQIRKRHAEELRLLAMPDDYLTLDWLFREYLGSMDFKGTAPDTQRRYLGAGKRLLNHQGTDKSNGKPSRLGAIDCRKLTPPQIRRILDKRKENYPKEPPTAGNSELNQELAVLTNMYRHGMEYFDELATLPKRPTNGIRKFKVPVRRHVPTVEDYNIMRGVAVEISTRVKYLPILMDLSWLLAARGIEVISLTVADRHKLPDGTYVIDVDRRKGSKNTSIICDGRLNAAWDAAIALHQLAPIGTSNLLVGREGASLTRSAVDNTWQRLKQEIEQRGLSQHYFTLHDLKRRGVTQSDDKAIAGQTEAMQRQYDQERRIFQPPKEPTK